MMSIGCSNGGPSGSTTNAPIETNVPSSALPLSAPNAKPIIENEDINPGLTGVDADNNGIRDDVDRLILKKYATTPAIKKAAEQEALALQQSLTATTRAQALAAGDEIRRAGACAYRIFPRATQQDVEFRQAMSREIEALTANTKERFIKYWESEKLGAGAVYLEPKEPVCD